MAGFFFTGEEAAALSPDAVARRRKLLDALQQDALSTAPVQHWTQGASRLVNALANGFEERRLNETEKAGNARIAQFLAGQLGASVSPTPPPAAAGGSASPPAAAPVSRGTSDAAASLINSESGGNWQAQNSAMGAGGMPGHFGRLQFGQARLQDAMNAGAIPQGTTPQQFMANPELQKAAEAWHFADIDKAIANGPAAAMIGKTINGIPVTQEGLRAVAHLGGTGGMNKFVQTNGAYNPADANGTTLSAYLQRHAGAGDAPATMATAPSVPTAPKPSPALAAALADPWLSRNPIVQQMLAAQLGRNPVDDALKRVQLAQAQRELEQPKAEWGIIAEDEFGNKKYGWIDKNARTTTPGPQPVPTATQPAPAPVASGAAPVAGQPAQGIPPAPPGVNPKVWRDKQTEKLVNPDKLTEVQAKDLNFYQRGVPANEALTKIEGALTSAPNTFASKLPGGNYMVSGDFQKATNAAKDFLAVILRKDTGAAVTEGEVATYGDIFLPKPGDSTETITQKREARARALEGIRLGLGTAKELVEFARPKASAAPQPEQSAAPKIRTYNPQTGRLE